MPTRWCQPQMLDLRSSLCSVSLLDERGGNSKQFTLPSPQRGRGDGGEGEEALTGKPFQRDHVSLNCRRSWRFGFPTGSLMSVRVLILICKKPVSPFPNRGKPGGQ